MTGAVRGENIEERLYIHIAIIGIRIETEGAIRAQNIFTDRTHNRSSLIGLMLVHPSFLQSTRKMTFLVCKTLLNSTFRHVRFVFERDVFEIVDSFEASDIGWKDIQ